MTTVKPKKTGTFAGIPYDWRNPSAKRFKSRVWNPNAQLLTKRWYGWGWDLNWYAIAHPHKWRQVRKKSQ